MAYVAYTGKAAQVLKNHGCPNATTAHKLLYKSVPRRNGTFRHIPKTYLDHNYKIIVVDEISMLPQKMWELLLTHGIYVLACGDPGQLPPVSDENTTVLDNPDIFLDEIMRQAKDSEIIRLSMAIREGKTIKPGKGNEVNIVKRPALCDGMMQWADQIICGRNNTRLAINNQMRKLKWGAKYQNVPFVGDKLICLKNNWDIISKDGAALVNGSSGILTKINKSPYSDRTFINFITDEGSSFDSVLLDWKLITEHEPTVNMTNFRKFNNENRPNEFDYGYGITTWKAQGDEYEKVLFIAEKMPYLEKDVYQKYLYTGCTRASSKLTLVLPN